MRKAAISMSLSQFKYGAIARSLCNYIFIQKKKKNFSDCGLHIGNKALLRLPAWHLNVVPLKH
jgi:hypothetical protein